MTERDDELAAWLQLLETPGVGRRTARRLLAAFGSPRAVFEADVDARRRIAGDAAADALDTPPAALAHTIDATRAWLDADPAARSVIALGDPRYPALLLETRDPPLLLYAQGRVERLNRPTLAIVGSRNPTAQGRDNARRFAATLSQAGITIASGLALGIDGEAHAGALDGDGGTVAVIGTGIDIVYPRRHRELARRIAEHGVIVSEFPLGTPPLAENFPQRNRIIAGLARATLVVEAATQSGSLITARLANEAGRDVLAIPGSIHSPLARGCHALIRQGAKLVESVDDVLEEFRPAPSTSRRPAMDPTRHDPALPDADASLLDALGYDPVTLDALAARTGRSPADLSVHLLQCELDGTVARLPGQLFQRIARA